MPAPIPGLAPPKPIPLKDRASILFIEKGQLDVLDSAFVVVDQRGVRTQIPVGGLACLMLEPGARISHAAAALAARVGCLIIWVGEAGVRLYSAGQPGGARADRLLYQARLALDEDARLRVVRKMFSMRFGEPAPERRSVDQLRGIEGARVKRLYELLATQHRVKWNSRRYEVGDFHAADLPNRCLSQATACCMAWRKPPSSRRAMPPRSAFFTPESRSRSCTTLRIFSSSKRSSRSPSRLQERPSGDRDPRLPAR